MKDFSFRHDVSTIRYLKEPKINKKINYDQIIFVLVIVLALGLLAKYLYGQLAVIEADGQILMEKTTVNFMNNIRIKEIYIQEGDTVQKDQVLFSYVTNVFDNQSDMYLKHAAFLQKNNETAESMEKEIAFKEFELSGLNQRLQYVKTRREEVAKLILLDVYKKSDLDDIERTELNLEAEKRALLKQLVFIKTKRKDFLATNQQTSLASYPEAEVLINHYKAPNKGVVGLINKSNEETCYAGEDLTTIHNPNKILIKAYFKLKDASELYELRTVTILFPDKYKSEGIIKKIQISTCELPKELQKIYHSTERNVVVEIEPVKPEDIQRWENLYKLHVKVLIQKYFN